ncbi:cytochrome C peroxidase [Bradyrhizobium japonicum SEMIA 5079]|nr:cytochrome C peroxidase [Bradyrhizobium japonicum SEMIA 5079]
MSGKLEEIVPKLRADRALDEAFREAYGRPIGSESIVDALVTFEKSLLTPGSRFDKWLQGDASAITATELEGYPIESADYRRSVRSIAVLRST